MGCGVSSDQLQISHLASGGRCLGGGTSRSARADIYKPVFPHRPEHSASKRYREVLRIMRSLQPLCGMSQTAFDCRELLILRWTTPPQSHAAAAAPFIPQESRHAYMSPGAGESLIPTAVKPAAAAVNGCGTPPESPATPLASLYQERTSHSNNDNNNIAGSSSNGGAMKPTTVMPSSSSNNNNNNNSSRALRKRISLAEVDRGFREAPFLAPQCTTNLSSICIRAFNTVKFYLGRSDREREDERLDVIEFHMVLSFVLSYLEALVLLDQEAPIYEEMYDQQDADHHIDNDVMLLSEALELLPLGSCANYPAGDASSAEAVARSLLQPSSSGVVISGGLVNRSSGSTFVVLQPFYENSCLPRLVAPADRFPRLRLKFPSQLVWNRAEDVPAAFRKDMLTPSTVLFPDLTRVQALMNPTPSSSANANNKLLTNSGISPQRGSWSGGITATSGSFRLNQSASFGSHHAATIMMQAEEGAAAAAGGGSSVASPELCEFLARAKLVSCFVEVVPNLSALTRSAI
ncbi:GPI-anchored surface protein, putative [Bodo saltans]|uniref:GPI-anchored surface protein, putative n=1 Tax=Bodo saltans TaxID=75058 RepID=A0A0S4IW53_BODSA|nr:GPI-anchored surface protein, putative [Bodo saltans]|eukprot:CUG05132.1 GPI-anchored surface protein, putative [Bodo saltans]